MSGSWLVNTMLGAVLLPPLNLLLLCVLGFVLRRRWPRAGTGLLLFSLVLLALLSTRPVASLLAGPLERSSAPLTLPYGGGAQAIVVLGGGRLGNAPEYAGFDSPNAATLRRMRYAAMLHRVTGLPLLVSGGAPEGGHASEAEIMARGLREDFGAAVKWEENDADNTADNARHSATMLRKEGVGHVLLVTDAMHMPRALRMFAQTGLDVTPAPTAFLTAERVLPYDFVPRAQWLVQSSYALHEWVGMAWYGLRYRSDPRSSGQ